MFVGAGFLPLPQSALGALLGNPPSITPIEPNGPNHDPFGSNPLYTHKSHAAGAKVNFGIIWATLSLLNKPRGV